jgi:long-chain acyl-CoA synthetase
MLRITDRKKDLLVTAGGKNVAPQKIEACLLESPWIAQAMVYGDRRPYLVALVTLDLDALSGWAREHRIDARGEELALHPDVRGLVESEIDLVNRKLASFETIKRFLIVPRELTIEAGELTPTHKIRRAAICARFAPALDRLYQ